MSAVAVPDVVSLEALVALNEANAALREENEYLADRLRMSEKLAFRSLVEPFDPTRTILPLPLVTAFKAAPGERHVISIWQTAVTLVIGEWVEMNACALDEAWGALIDVFEATGGDHAGVGVPRIVRTEMPQRVAAMAWRCGGQPVVVCGPDADRADVRTALRVAGRAS